MSTNIENETKPRILRFGKTKAIRQLDFDLDRVVRSNISRLCLGLVEWGIPTDVGIQMTNQSGIKPNIERKLLDYEY